MAEPLDVTAIRHPLDGSVLDIAPFHLDAGEHRALFGPNGSGKTTLLRLLAGTLDGGHAVDAAYLPQRPYFFKGTAMRNLVLGLAQPEQEEALKLATAFGVAPLLDSEGTALSGGERQRVALASVLARDRSTVLLDEPLAPLDLRDRDSIMATIAEALRGRTALIASHDIESVAALAGTVSVMIGGAIRQSGPVQEVFAAPADDEVAGVVGVANVLEGTVVSRTGPLVDVVCGPLTVRAVGDPPDGSAVKVLFGAETVGVFAGVMPSGSPRNVWSGHVSVIRTIGRLVEIEVDCGVLIAAIVTPGALDALGVGVGDEVRLAVKATAVRAVATRSDR